MIEIENKYFSKTLKNNKTDLEMNRIFIQAKFQKK
jgi:hypothetical protein